MDQVYGVIQEDLQHSQPVGHAAGAAGEVDHQGRRPHASHTAAERRAR